MSANAHTTTSVLEPQINKVTDTYRAHLVRSQAKRLTPYITYGREFLEYISPGPLNRGAIQAYMGHLERLGHTSMTRQFIFQVLRTLYSVNNMEWPMRKEDRPRYAHDASTPALHPRAIEAMIRTALEGKTTEEEAYLLALLSTYGFHLVGISRLQSSSLKVEKRLLSIPTANGEAPRLHLIPPEVIPYIHVKGKWNRHGQSLRWWRRAWSSLERKAGITHHPRAGPLSVRRTLDTLLNERVPAIVVRAFFESSSPSSSSLQKRYHQVSFVGSTEEQSYQAGWWQEQDEQVFKEHPFLPLWRGTF